MSRPDAAGSPYASPEENAAPVCENRGGGLDAWDASRAQARPRNATTFLSLTDQRTLIYTLINIT